MKCKKFGCSNDAAKDQTYCCKSHAPYSHLAGGVDTHEAPPDRSPYRRDDFKPLTEVDKFKFERKKWREKNPKRNENE